MLLARVLSLIMLCWCSFLSSPAAAQALDTVTIVASRARPSHAGRSVLVMGRDEIVRSSARTVADVLSTVMGVDVNFRSAAQADLSMRGSSSEQVVVLVDGVRMTDVQSSHYTLDLAVPLSAVERIEVLRGSGSALYGPDAVGGVINIVTRRAASSEVHLRPGSFGSVGGGFATGLTGSALSLSASADFDKSDGHRDGTDHRIGQGRVSLSMPAASGVLRTNVAAGVRDFGAAAFYGPYDSYERTATTTFDSRWDLSLGAWSLGLAGSTRRHEDHYVLIRNDPSVYENRHETWKSAGELVAKRDIGAVALAFGAEGVHDQLSSARLGGRREWRAALFAEGTVGTPTTVLAQAGLRGDHSAVYGDFLSPSMSVGAPVASWLRVHASGGLGFRAPTWTERHYTDPSNQGNPDLRPERFLTGDIGARGSVRRWALDVTVFTRRATQLIDWVRPEDAPVATPWRTMNVGKATYRGLEAALELPTVRGVTTSLFGARLALEAPGAESLVGKYALRPVTRQAGVRVASPAGRALSASLDLLHARRRTERGYVTGNARIAWQRGAYRLTFDVRNIANASWLDAAGMSVAGRGVYGGIEWRRGTPSR